MAARSAAAPACCRPARSARSTPPGLAAVGRIEACRTAADGCTAQTTRYLVLSRPLAPKKLLEVVRAHWSIENHLHSTLDVIFDEDEARSRKNYAPENLP